MSESYLKFIYFAFVCAINLTLAFLVYFRNRRRLVNQLFAASVLWVVGWTVSNYLLHVFAGTVTGILWGRATFAAASLIPASYLAFANTFPSSQKLSRDPLVLVFAAIGGLFFFASFTSLIVIDVSYDPVGLRLTYGPLYPGFAAYFLLCFATSFYVLWKKYRVVRGAERLRIRYLFVGTLLAVAGGVTTNLLIPLLFRTSRFSLFGPAFTIFVFAFVAHAIIRHRLMDIRIVIRKGATYALSLLVTAVILVSASALVYATFNPQLSEATFIFTILVGTGIAIAFRPLVMFFQSLVDRYGYRASYDYHRTLEDVIRALPSFLERDALFVYIWDVVRHTIQLETFTIYLVDAGIFQPVFFQTLTRDAPNPSTYRSDRSLFLKRLQTSREPLVREEILVIPEDAPGELIFHELTERQWDLLLPIRHERELTGFIALGPKLSGDPYFSSDIELLVTVTNQAGIVLENASLYQEVKTVKEHTEEILRNMESGLIAVDGNGKITTVNAVAETLLGLTASSLQGKPMETLPSTLATPLADAICKGHRSFQSEAQLLAQNGRIVSIVLSTSMIRDSEGHILGAILVFSDHSKIKELEREKRRAERLTAFQALASGVAHEIKNPLVAIKTFAELLPERFTEKDFREEFSAVVIREIDRIDALVARLRGLATPAAQPLTPLDLRIPIEETLALLRGQIEQARITVKSTYEGELPLVNGDNAQLKQLFLNLFMNAFEAMEPGGKLLVRLTTGEDSGSPTLMVKVSDTGTGIPDALMGKIFDPFVTTKPGGSGLGLSICRGIADAHRATIRANNNTEGSGTTIEIGFPTVSISRVALKT